MGLSTLSGDMLVRILSQAKDVVIAAPYIKANALSRVLTNVRADLSLACVTRWQVQDIVLGASDVECRTIVNELGGVFKLHPTLHAKYYRADEKVLLGSANLTYSALGWSADPNLEILCTAGPDFDSDAFERQLLDDSREISDTELTHWQSLESIQAPIDKQPQLDTWRPITRDPTNLLLAYRGLTEEIASSDEQRASLHDLEFLQVPEGLTNQQVTDWVSVCLIVSPFVQSVLKAQKVEPSDVVRTIAQAYTLNITDARRSIEAAQIWAAFFIPE